MHPEFSGTRSVPENVSGHLENYREPFFENVARNKGGNTFGNQTLSGTFSGTSHLRKGTLFLALFWFLGSVKGLVWLFRGALEAGGEVMPVVV